jgi:hypothetical protein
LNEILNYRAHTHTKKACIYYREEFNFLNVSLYVCMGGERLGADQNKIYIFFLLFYQQNLNFYIYIIGFLYKSCIHILIG